MIDTLLSAIVTFVVEIISATGYLGVALLMVSVPDPLPV